MSGNCPPYGSKSIHPPKPLGPEYHHYTVLDLKDTFFCIPLAPTDPDTEVLGQLTWTRLPQGFKNSPTLFDEALNISKPFWLFVHEKQGAAKGVLTQTLGPWSQPVTYLSKRLDPVASGWPACLRSVAATALLVKEVDKLTLEKELNLVAPYGVESLLHGALGKRMSKAHTVQYQALLLDRPHIKFLKATVLNPAMLLPDSEPEDPIHDCQQTMDVLHAA
ncbi:Pol polyprotein [Plecturocebus cupreus]